MTERRSDTAPCLLCQYPAQVFTSPAGSGADPPYEPDISNIMK